MEKISYTEFIDNIVEKSKDSNQILYATIELTLIKMICLKY